MYLVNSFHSEPSPEAHGRGGIGEGEKRRLTIEPQLSLRQAERMAKGGRMEEGAGREARAWVGNESRDLSPVYDDDDDGIGLFRHAVASRLRASFSSRDRLAA